MNSRLWLAIFMVLLSFQVVSALQVQPVEENPIPGMTKAEALRITEVMQSKNADCRWRYDKAMVIDYLLTGKGYTFKTGIGLQECVRIAMGKPIGPGFTRGMEKEKPKFERKSPIAKPLTEEEVLAKELKVKREQGKRIANVVRRSDAVCRRLYNEDVMAEFFVSGKGTSAKERSLEQCLGLGKTLLGYEMGTLTAPAATYVQNRPPSNKPAIELPGTLQDWQVSRIIDAAMTARISGKACRNYYDRGELKAALLDGVAPAQTAELLRQGNNPDVFDCVRNGLRISNIRVR